jgi:hypothetical protein
MTRSLPMSLFPEQLVNLEEYVLQGSPTCLHIPYISTPWVPVLPGPAETFPQILVVRENCVKILQTM